MAIFIYGTANNTGKNFFTHQDRRDFFLRGGFLDGKTGFIVCKLSSIGVFLRYVKLKELKNNSLTK